VNPKYTIIWCILQVWVILLGGCLTCEELVGPPDRRDSKPRSPMQAEIRLTTLCIERWGASALLPLPSVLTTLASQSVKYITAHLRTG
jgi:hypothetical protein